ncbi:MAG: hypothetical protein ACRC92_21405 [Peptostreptococcaceae bacterium]
MNNKKTYINLYEAIMEGEREHRELQDYISMIVPERSSDKEYIEKLSYKVCDIYNEVDLNVDKYWIADNYISMLREVKAF